MVLSPCQSIIHMYTYVVGDSCTAAVTFTVRTCLLQNILAACKLFSTKPEHMGTLNSVLVKKQMFLVCLRFSF